MPRLAGWPTTNRLHAALAFGAAWACCAQASAAPAPAATHRPTALVVFVESAAPGVQRLFASSPSLSVAIMSATQGSYSTAQALLDMTQGARVSPSAYKPSRTPG